MTVPSMAVWSLLAPFRTSTTILLRIVDHSLPGKSSVPRQSRRCVQPHALSVLTHALHISRGHKLQLLPISSQSCSDWYTVLL
jgi:hypothetical protein